MTGKIVITGALLLTTPAIAHHNAAAHYRLGESIAIEGVVTEFRAVNPHARIYFEVRRADGAREAWMAEGDSFVNLRRAGWGVDELKPGDRIAIVGHPSRDGSNLVEWTAITVSEGTELGGGNGQLEERMRFLEQALGRHRAQLPLAP